MGLKASKSLNYLKKILKCPEKARIAKLLAEFRARFIRNL
jgi:hypothetical protein